MNTNTTHTETVIRGRVPVTLTETATEGGELRITASIPSRIWPDENEIVCWITRWYDEDAWRLVFRGEILGLCEDRLARDWVSHRAALVWELGR